MKTKLKIFNTGMIDISPLLIPVIPFGIIFGVLGMELGLGPYLTCAISIIICGGASQIVLIQLFTAGASPLIILSSIGAVNSRHLLYGAVLSRYFSKLNLLWKIILSYLNYDQSFAVSYNYFKSNKIDSNSHYHLLGSGLLLWFVWQLSTLIGVILGAVIPDELGLNFAIPLTFLAILVHDLQKLNNILVMLTSGIIATIGYNLIPFKAYIIVAAISGLIIATIITSLNYSKK
ncbi:AzlC family ABC transporter permease [Candidatus Pelagibacter sp.]|jgi:4-azaleucine resistance transporter AzlC|nr:AzlC family ABC transporter permease [Candidatus Pelagibacter sp.]